MLLDCILVGIAWTDQRQRNQAGNVSVVAGIPVSVHSKSVSQSMHDEEDSEGHWLHLWNNLVGLWPQSHCILHCLPCKQLHCPNLCCVSCNESKKNVLFQVAGGCWYVLAIQRVASCFQFQCQKNDTCHLLSHACSDGFCKTNELICSSIAVCFNGDGSFQYGIYDWAVPVVSSSSLAVKILYSLFWGLMTLRYEFFRDF